MTKSGAAPRPASRPRLPRRLSILARQKAFAARINRDHQERRPGMGLFFSKSACVSARDPRSGACRRPVSASNSDDVDGAKSPKRTTLRSARASYSRYVPVSFRAPAARPSTGRLRRRRAAHRAQHSPGGGSHRYLRNSNGSLQSNYRGAHKDVIAERFAGGARLSKPLSPSSPDRFGLAPLPHPSQIW